MSNSGFEHLDKEILHKVSRVVEGTDDQFLHVFGGRRQHKGTTPHGCKAPLHLLYTFDTTDPAFPIKVPGIRYLPLYYSFDAVPAGSGVIWKAEATADRP
jgi:hypothetical protein